MSRFHNTGVTICAVVKMKTHILMACLRPYLSAVKPAKATPKTAPNSIATVCNCLLKLKQVKDPPFRMPQWSWERPRIICTRKPFQKLAPLDPPEGSIWGNRDVNGGITKMIEITPCYRQQDGDVSRGQVLRGQTLKREPDRTSYPNRIPPKLANKAQLST